MPKRYPGSPKIPLSISIIVFLLMVASGCNDQTPGSRININIQIDGKQITSNASPGSTVQNAIDLAGIHLTNLDIVKPPTGDPVFENMVIKIVRVEEVFDVEETIIPFERQSMRNETLPAGKVLLIQKGINGIQQTTYRRVKEDGVEASKSIIKTVIIKESLPEIEMVGVQSPFTEAAILGKIVYLTAGNAWIMESSTGNRKPVVTSGDLDGRVFSLSPDGSWLLYSRSSNEGADEGINSLWAVNVTTQNTEPVNLGTKNVIHHADWVPEAGLTVSYSTVEPRGTAPGWQANNDLYILSFNPSGAILRRDLVVEENSGGVYGWWGVTYSWSQDGKALAFARPGSVGLIDQESGTGKAQIEIIPMQTKGDWAWVPGLGWAPDHSVLFTVFHNSKPGQINQDASPIFDVVGELQTDPYQMITLVEQAGMFAYPIPSPEYSNNSYLVAYLQAIFTEQSETSHYNLMVMDQDGSNKTILFPENGSQGISPQEVEWGPGGQGKEGLSIAIVYQGNLWLINPVTKEAQQITGDGSINKIDWK